MLWTLLQPKRINVFSANVFANTRRRRIYETFRRVHVHHNTPYGRKRRFLVCKPSRVHETKKWDCALFRRLIKNCGITRHDLHVVSYLIRSIRGQLFRIVDFFFYIKHSVGRVRGSVHTEKALTIVTFIKHTAFVITPKSWFSRWLFIRTTVIFRNLKSRRVSDFIEVPFYRARHYILHNYYEMSTFRRSNEKIITFEFK